VVIILFAALLMLIATMSASTGLLVKPHNTVLKAEKYYQYQELLSANWFLSIHIANLAGSLLKHFRKIFEESAGRNIFQYGMILC
jgi:hypothetical protein